MELFHLPLVFDHGHDVAQHLAGMVQVGEGVDHRHRGISGQLVDNGLAIGADDHAVHITGHDPGHVLEGLVAGQLGVPAGEIDHLAAQAVHGRFKGDPGPGGGLFKDEGHGFSGQLLMADPGLGFFFKEQGLLDVGAKLFLAEVL